jgi:hypothetical protein
MPTPCPEHSENPQMSCPACYSEEELQGMLDVLNSVKIPSSPLQGSRKKHTRSDELPSRKTTWRERLEQDDDDMDIIKET